MKCEVKITCKKRLAFSDKGEKLRRPIAYIKDPLAFENRKE